MEHKFKKFIYLFIFALSVFAGIQKVMAVDIVNMPLTSGNTPAAYSAGNSGVVLNKTATGSVTYSGSLGASCTGWDATIGKSWVTTAINTENFYNITVTAQGMSDATGPRDFQLDYSLNGSSWTKVADLPSKSTSTTTFGSFSLPSNCNFQTTVYIRFATSSITQQDGVGNVLAGSKSTIKGLVVAGDELTAPTTQASNISLVAITPTQITIGCSQGTGTKRIIVMNSTNSFTNPVNNTVYTANSTWLNAGEQVVYNGTGTDVTITVPSSLNEYWFRVYDYNEQGAQIRYLTTTSVLNPRQCLLEGVTLPTATNIKLTEATLGGTITSPASGTITGRGIYWSLSPNVTIYDNQVTEGGTGVGAFSTLVNSLPRSTTIYFKAYVDNLSGTSISEEASFSNVPVFTGTGNWENAARWNVQEVPGSANAPTGDTNDSPVIDGNCTLSSSVTDCMDLTINNGRSLTIGAGQSLIVQGTITNNAAASGIVIKASPTLANGSLIFMNGNPYGTVEMYSKANWNLSNPVNNKYKWQYFGVPVKTTTLGATFSGSFYVRKWDETITDYNLIWGSPLAGGAVMNSFEGYELVQPTQTTYVFTGELENTSMSKSLPYTSAAYYKGNHIISNPYTAAIPIANLTFGANTEQAVYLYNTGTYSDWLTNSGGSTPGSGPGTYTVSTPATAGIGLVPGEIPSMQGYLVYSNNVAGGSIGFDYLNLTRNTTQQRVKKQSNKTYTRIDLIGTKFTDRMWIFSDDNCTVGFDNGWDGKKLLGDTQVSQLYAIEESGNYQINAVKDINERYIGLQAGQDTQFKLVFNHENIADKYTKLYLVDMVENKTIDITANESEYSFTASATDNVKRFKIVSNSTAVNNVNTPEISIYNDNNQLIINNKTNEAGSLIVYNTVGHTMLKDKISANGISRLSTNLTSGTYIVKALVNSEEIIQRIIVK